MNTRELIEVLKQCDPHSEVVVAVQYEGSALCGPSFGVKSVTHAAGMYPVLVADCTMEELAVIV